MDVSDVPAEILLEAKGYTDVMVNINDSGVEVLVTATELTDAMQAQIKDIVKRKTGVDGANIVIYLVDE